VILENLVEELLGVSCLRLQLPNPGQDESISSVETFPRLFTRSSSSFMISRATSSEVPVTREAL
jgi:hypothetical protein